jgi:hypothetical protein
MKHTHQSTEFTHLLSAFAISLIIAGVVFAAMGALHSFTGDLTGQGSSILIPSIANGKITMVHAIPASTHGAAPSASADLQIALGMLFLLSGCVLHGLWTTCHAHPRGHRRSR